MSINYEKLRQIRNETNMFAIYNGAVITEIGDGYAKSEMEITENSMNPVGSVHGGAIFLLADISCGGAASSTGNMVATVDTSIYYLKAGINTEKIFAEARVVKWGKRLITIRFTVSDQDGNVLSEGMCTFANLNKQYDLS